MEKIKSYEQFVNEMSGGSERDKHNVSHGMVCKECGKKIDKPSGRPSLCEECARKHDRGSK